MSKADKYAPVTEVTFEEPPFRAAFDWEAIAARLKARPMEWARITEGGRLSVANAVRQGSVAAVHPDLGFEAKTTNNKREAPRTCDLWLRWNPHREDGVKAVLRESRKVKG